MRGLDALAAGDHRGHPPVADLELLDRRAEADLAAVGDDLVGHRLPHLARPEARVVELADQRLDLALVAEERGLGGGGEGQALDALGRPLRAQLGGRDAPHLLGVGLEEVLVEPLAEAVGDPLLDVVLLALGLHLRPQVGEPRADQLDRAELAHDVHAVERIREELAVPEDPRHARAQQELLLHHLVPEIVDLLGLGEEAMPTQIEAVAVADLGLREAADLVLGLEDDHGHALLGEQVAGGQTGGAAAEDGDRRALGRAALTRDDFELNSGHARHLVHWRAPAHARLTAANTP